MKLPYILLLSAGLFSAGNVFAAKNSFEPGAVWNDTSGKHINAHGGCVIFHEGTYYWFGEDRTGYDSNGVSCYTSTDLYNWKRQGLVFKVSQALDETTGKCILERPKVVYNDKTDKWVMYIHWENGNGYGEARVCVAVADEINGDYEFVSTFRPNGHDSRDQTVFKDADGKAYHFGSTDMNTNMNVALLSEDYLTTETNPVTETKILRGLRYEAPAIIRVGDTYFGVFSGCTGWDPNPGHSATATEILGTWTAGRNFAIDQGAATTYKSQSTYIYKVDGIEGAYVYMGDRWNSSDVGGKSEYVWLPLSVRSGAPTVKWYDKWDLSVFDNCGRFERIVAPADGLVVRLLDKYSDRWVSTKNNSIYIDDDNDATNMSIRLEATDNPYVWHLVDPATGNCLESVFGALSFAQPNGERTQDWRLSVQEDGCYKIQNMNDSKVLSVSGSAQLAGTPIFMSADGAATSQFFGLYFDSREYDYEAADMFSAAYRAANIKAMEEQRDYEASASLDVPGASEAFSVKTLDASSIAVTSANDAEARVAVVAVSGRTVHSCTVALKAGENVVALPLSLQPGVYMVDISTAAGRTVAKLAL
ncbi:MAG: family 43 glycosylhydrolase [Muribaculaceae bacterium]|nr:family 43 glycosylhydrolase [Muribaculaceae bacterium]